MDKVWLVEELNEDNDITNITLYETREKALEKAKKLVNIYCDIYDYDEQERKYMYLSLQSGNHAQYVAHLECKKIY